MSGQTSNATQLLSDMPRTVLQRDAAIPRAPRSLRTYLLQVVPLRVRRMTTALSPYATAGQEIPEELAQDMGYYSYNNFRVLRRIATIATDSGSWGNTLAGLESLASGIVQFSDSSRFSFVEQMQHILQAVDDLIMPLRSSLEELEHLEESGDLESLIELGSSRYVDWASPEMARARPAYDQVVKLAQDAPSIIRGCLSGLEDIRVKVGAQKDESSRKLRASDGDTPPPTEKIEVLFHATLNAAELAERGFQLEMPPEGGGLGGSQTAARGHKGISFTDDIYVARQIVRAFHEAIGIARGQITEKHVREWMRTDGVPDPRPVDEEDWHRLGKKEKVWELYQRYLALSTRFNPVFFNVPLRVFERVDPNDVGIIAAHVDMNHEGLRYLSAMNEWRVPPAAIVPKSTRRVASGS